MHEESRIHNLELPAARSASPGTLELLADQMARNTSTGGSLWSFPTTPSANYPGSRRQSKCLPIRTGDKHVDLCFYILYNVEDKVRNGKR